MLSLGSIEGIALRSVIVSSVSVVLVAALAGCVGTGSSPDATRITRTPAPTSSTPVPLSGAPTKSRPERDAPSTAPSSPSGERAESAARDAAIESCEIIRNSIELDRTQILEGQAQAASTAARAASLSAVWKQLEADMTALANAPIPENNDSNADWNPHLDAYFIVANKDCAQLGVQLPQG